MKTVIRTAETHPLSLAPARRQAAGLAGRVSQQKWL